MKIQDLIDLPSPEDTTSMFTSLVAEAAYMIVTQFSCSLQIDVVVEGLIECKVE